MFKLTDSCNWKINIYFNNWSWLSIFRWSICYFCRFYVFTKHKTLWFNN